MRNRRPLERVQRSNPEQEHQANRWIRSPTVRLIDEQGQNVGIMPTNQALERARALELDLITISAEADPPVCKIYDLSKYMYELKKVRKEQERKNRENEVVVKELQLRPGINEHDLLIKQRHAKEFLADNNKIKVVMRFRGREMAFANRGFDLIAKFMQGLGDHKVEKEPNLAGNTILTIIAPPAKITKS